MVAAGWLHEYAFRLGDGIDLDWSNEGRSRAVLLRRIVESFRLSSKPLNAVNFDVLCSNATKGNTNAPIDPDIAKFWCSCMNDLNLACDECDYISLLQALSEFGPTDSNAMEVYPS